MGTEIGLLSSMTQIQKLSNPDTTPNNHNNHLLLLLQSHPLSNPSSSSSSTSFRIMWNPRDPQEEDDSWEVRAFAQDTTNIMGTTWPPRSYTCTFCRREFRSAQALGGHMNVHRRDRARLHHHHHQLPPPSAAAAATATAASVHNNLISPHHHHQELVVANNNNGRFFLYHLPNPDEIGHFSGTNNYSSHNLASSSSLNACGDSSVSVLPTTVLSILPYPPSNNNLVSITGTTPSYDFQLERRPQGFVNSSSSYCDSSNKVEQPTTSSFAGNGGHEELDLELRLGHRPPEP